ncbi:DNA repair protein RecN [Alteromonas oceanisediminis]|uniref:DNA repair protein RecN n=1 Tax=Alteromonas oceanisediminis TaxID=2836180 RepID=UPI001BDB4710|nr:DNA repair protein RecN [Alteromonas oceanisediminis]MBT0588068.1 DNA repair protein RecN [Alteromonas oceanisediminis]
MLTHLSIQNFAVVKNISLSLAEGMSAITGETGAGKSIGIDALSLCIGGRADANMVRSGAAKAEIIAHFDINNRTKVQQWLVEHELDDEGECFIRRVISAEGRSKAFINGIPVSLQQLKQLGAFLISIHGQNAHQSLLKDSVQRQLLDNFAEHPELVTQTQSAYKVLNEAQSRFEYLQSQAQAREDRVQLLSYQVSELDEFGLGDTEFESLEIEHKRLSNSQALLEETQHSYARLYDDDEFNALSAIQQSVDSLQDLCDSDPALEPIVSLLNEAAIQVKEAATELRAYNEDLDVDPAEIAEVQARFDKVNELARKHQVMPEMLYSHHMTLAQELSDIHNASDELEDMQTRLDKLKADYNQAAQRLSESRQAHAIELAAAIETQIQRMNMPHATLSIDVAFSPEKRSALGSDDVTFLIATNPGQKADSLDKVVSGGELARIGLAMHVIASNNGAIPTLIFDEVDTGISGPTASIVGQLLRTMGKHAQVLCVTHLPQVAAQAHNQLFVTKQVTGNNTETQILNLSADDRISELARLLAGDKVTESALSNARSLLENVAQ